MAAENLLKLFFLKLDGNDVAAVMCFDYRNTRFLYNSGYDNRCRHLNVGLLSKVLSLKDGIEQGLKRYDFLKGDEVYKKRLGAEPVEIQRCNVALDP